MAPFILESLELIGALDYKRMLDEFIEKHDISLNNLSSFKIEDIADYEVQVARYPFDDFDDSYYELYEKNPLEVLLLNYSKLSLADFA